MSWSSKTPRNFAIQMRDSIQQNATEGICWRAELGPQFSHRYRKVMIRNEVSANRLT
jgi:hypothetical protein